MSLVNYSYERKCYLCEHRTYIPPPPPRPRVRFTETVYRMLSPPTTIHYSVKRSTTPPRVIRLTSDQEAVLQRHFNMWPRAPHPADVVLLAAETGLSEDDVEGWYQIRLAQWRKEQGLGGNLGLH